MNQIPQRIVCLSAEAADWLWRIGAWKSIIGVTVYFTQPDDELPKPRISGFSSANLNEITKLNPDLIITYSDVQAKLATELIQRGFPVLATNQRTLKETEMTLELLARIVNCEREGEKLLNEFRDRLAPVENVMRRPRVYFEEWDNPLISGIAWVSELIQRAGGADIFPELQTKRTALERAVSSEQIIQGNPEIIFASWCGEPVQTDIIATRPGWNDVVAVREKRIHEIPGEDILQPGFRLVYGYEQIKRLLADAWQ
jgi:iron complex transport system substrate-binding protein